MASEMAIKMTTGQNIAVIGFLVNGMNSLRGQIGQGGIEVNELRILIVSIVLALLAWFLL